MNTINPFSDPNFKKQVLGKENIIDPVEVEVVDDISNIIATAPVIPGTVKNVIYDASAIAKNSNDQKASEMSLALNDIFTRYNKEYNTDLQIDFSSLSRTLINVSNPKTRHTLELYLSEVFQSVRPVLILHMISKLTLAIDYILDPQRMLGGEMTIQDVFVAVEKIMQFIQQLEDMKKDVIIQGSSLELKKLAEDSENSELDNPESKQAIEDFMTLFKKDNGII